MPRTACPPALLLALLAAIDFGHGAAAQAASAPSTQPPDEITLERIMAHPDWLGTPPEEPYWADDGRAVYFRRKRTGEDIRDLWRIDLARCKPGVVCTPVRVEPKDMGRADAPGGSWSRDRRQKVYVREGDVYWKDVTTGDVRQLTRTGEEESDARFLWGDRQVAYRRGGGGGSFFVRDLATGLESQPAELRLEKDPAAPPEYEEDEEDQEWLAEQQRRLFSTLRERKEREDRAREEARAEQRADPARPPLPWYLGDDVEVLDSALSSDARWLIVLLGEKDREEGPTDNMPDFVSASGYVEMEQVRPKVGTVDPQSPRVVLLDLARHVRHDLDLAALPGIADDPLRELREKAAAARAEARRQAEAEREAAGRGARAAGPEERQEAERAEREEALAEGDRTLDEEVRERQEAERGQTAERTAEQEERAREEGAVQEAEEDAAAAAERKGGGETGEDEEPELRAVEVEGIVWNDRGDRVAIQFLSEDNKDRWLALVDLEAGRLLPLEHWSDPAWINDYDFLDVGWLRDHTTLWFLAEEDGFSHLYLRAVNPSNSEPVKRRLTSGPFEVSAPALTPDGKAFLVTANREHPGIHETYRLPVGGGELERLTALGGESTAVPSPDGRRLLVLHSSPTDPPELSVQDARPGAPPQRLTETSSPEFRAIRWTPPQVVEVPSTHGAPRPIYSRVYVPEGWSPDRRWPAVVFIHGAGYLQNAHLGWSSYFREFMFHSLLTRRGYVVLDMDYRASAGYGRDWRTAIYRQMGYPEVEDLADGVAWLAANRAVDPQRVGVYGGSYGGFLTFMALFRQPDLFACGAALRPVSDWAHYNHGYTSNILNTPEVDPEAYARSSPIEHAAGLAKPLLIAHGMVDDNVVFQDSVRLVQRLIELEKQDFETAIYPVEPHSFREPASWLDEYRRIYKLFEGCLKAG